jgi:hypothetical protein
MMVDEEAVSRAVRELTQPQREALLHRQEEMFDRASVFARGVTTGALRRRGIIAGSMPHARLTPLGEAVCQRLEAVGR